MLKNSTKLKYLLILVICLIAVSAAGQEKIGLGDLSRLMEIHPPRRPPAEMSSLDQFETKIAFEKGAPPAALAIPGFKYYGCGECHDSDALAQKTADTLRRAMSYIKREVPAVREIPLRRFIIQPWSDALLKENQFAHATFDAIRVFPRTLIIDANVYRNATLIHETLHLTQPFVGHANELEAYALNALTDPRFSLFNYRYFENTIQAFHIPDFQAILRKFFARETKREWKIPAETQWFMLPADESALERIATAVRALRPAIGEAFRVNRTNPLLVSYWSDRTGVPSLALDLAAVRLLPLPQLTVSPELRDKAFQIFSRQFDKTDNTALGYVIDRKKETLMTLRYQHSLQDEGQGLALYFHFIRKRFFGEDGKLNLETDNLDDFKNFLEKKSGEIRKLAEYPGMSSEERNAGLGLAERMESFPKTLSASPGRE